MTKWQLNENRVLRNYNYVLFHKMYGILFRQEINNWQYNIYLTVCEGINEVKNVKPNNRNQKHFKCKFSSNTATQF